MPCYRCATIQTDPTKGASPWARGVVRDALVLVCPDCQQAHDWVGDLDRCAACGETALVRALGETRCRRCDYTGPGLPAGTAVGTSAGPAGPPGGRQSLEEDVTAALERLRSRRSP